MLRIAVVITAAALLGGTACNSDEVTGGHGTPVDAALFISGAEVTPTLTLTTGQTVRIEVRFLDDEGDEIHGLEDGHFTSLTFTPGALATVTPVADQPFFLDVTAGAPGTGTVSVGYGHDEAADEDSFGPFDVTVQ